MNYSEVITLIKMAAREGKYEITIPKVKDEYIFIKLSLARADFEVTFPNPDEMTISWINPRFRAMDALMLTNSTINYCKDINLL